LLFRYTLLTKQNLENMSRVNLVENINIRVGLEDMDILRKQAAERRMPVSTLCREKITKDLVP